MRALDNSLGDGRECGPRANDARHYFEEPLPDTDKFGLGERAGLWTCTAHCVQQPERSSVQYEADLIGRRAVAGCAVGGKLGLVQFYQIFHLPALTIDLLEQAPRITCQRGHDGSECRPPDARSQVHWGRAAVRLRAVRSPEVDARRVFQARDRRL